LAASYFGKSTSRPQCDGSKLVQNGRCKRSLLLFASKLQSTSQLDKKRHRQPRFCPNYNTKQNGLANDSTSRANMGHLGVCVSHLCRASLSVLGTRTLHLVTPIPLDPPHCAIALFADKPGLAKPLPPCWSGFADSAIRPKCGHIHDTVWG
jgi:hypothetical protein